MANVGHGVKPHTRTVRNKSNKLNVDNLINVIYVDVICIHVTSIRFYMYAFGKCARLTRSRNNAKLNGKP